MKNLKVFLVIIREKINYLREPDSCKKQPSYQAGVLTELIISTENRYCLRNLSVLREEHLYEH